MRPFATPILLATALGAAPAAAAPVADLLVAVASNARFAVPTRADVTIERRKDAHATLGTAVLVGRGQTLYVETRDGTRALVRPSKIVVRENGRAVRARPGARLGATDLLLEDLVPIGPWSLKLPQVSDEGPMGTVVTGAPAIASTRVLVVLTIDPESHVVTRTKYYEKSISDLAAFRRDEDFVDVDGHARATRITVDRTRDETSTQLGLSWRPAPQAIRDLFTLRGLRAPSPIAW